MTLPRWNDPALKAGTRIRTALWLVSEVGVGNSFTKEQHRAAFSGIAQADRRLRDLRDSGWVIHTSAEDVTLNRDEQRLVRVGSPVWERGVREGSAIKPLTAKMRRKTFAESDYQCVICGIAGGERYTDAPHKTAQLVASRRRVTGSNGQTQTMLVSECERCRSGTTTGPVDLPTLLERINTLDAADRAVFVQWTDGNRRSPLDSVWADFRRLPAAARDEVRRRLKES